MRTLISIMLFIIFIISSNNLFSQVFQGDWEEIGPVDIPQVFAQDEAAVGIGRINDIELHPNWNGTSNRKILAGAFNGGMWFSEDNGGTWENMNSDDWDVLGVSDIEYDPDDTNTIFVATGDHDIQFGRYKSELGGSEGRKTRGIKKSTDHGANWNDLCSVPPCKYAYPSKVTIGGMVISDEVPDYLIVVANEFRFRHTGVPSTAIVYKVNVSNGSVTLLDSIEQEYVREIEYKPGSADTMYMSGMYVYRSLNGGSSWTKINNGIGSVIEDSTRWRSVVAVTADEPEYVYALVSYYDFIEEETWHRIFRSTNSGDSFSDRSGDRSLTNNAPTNPDFRYVLSVNPADAEHIICGSLDLYESRNGGTNLNEVSVWWNSYSVSSHLHADPHDVTFAPDGSVFTGNDGGIYRGTWSGSAWAWTDITSGIGIAEGEAISVSQSNKNKVLAGMFHTGTNLRYDTLFTSNSGWGNVSGGDGGMCYIDYQFDSIMYRSDEFNGSMRRTHDLFTEGSLGINVKPKNGYKYQAYTLHPSKPNIIYSGLDHVFVDSSRGSGGWTQLTSHNYVKSLGEIVSIAVSPSNPDVIWFSYICQRWDFDSLENVIFKSMNGGLNWTDVTSISNDLDNNIHSNRMIEIAINPQNPDIVCIAFNVLNGRTQIRRTTNGGSSWSNYNNFTELPYVVHSLKYYPGSEDLLFAGTDFGVYYRDGESGSWTPFSDSLPNTQVIDISFDQCNGEIYVATKGRGTWKSDIKPLLDEDFATEVEGIVSNEDYRVFASDVVVKSGDTWTVRGIIAMATGKRIIVERGAKLIVDGGTITSQCGDHWTGIEVWGNRNADQFPIFSNTDQGLVQLNDAVIENARTAVSTAKKNPTIQWNYTGGIIIAVNSTFRNCRRAFEYLSYKNTNPVNGSPIGNAGRIVSCSLLLDNGFYNPGDQDISLVTLFDVDGVRFIGNTFLNQSDSSMKHNAIYADNAGFSVENKFNISSTQSNQFSNFRYAIKSHGFNSYKFVKIDGCNFNGNFRSVYVSGQLFPRITNNSINLPQLSGEYDGDGAYGIYLHDSRGYRAEGNTITGQFDPQGTGPSFVKTEIGTYTTSSGSFGNMIYKNKINGAKVSNVARYDNSGLRYLCNEMSNYKYAIASYETGIHVFQGNCGTEGGEDAANTFDNDGDKELKSQSNFEYFYRNSSPYIPATHDNPVTITACPGGEERDCPLLLESLPFDPGGDYEQSKTEANGFVLGLEEASGEEEEAYLFSEFFNQYSLASMHALSITDTIDSLEFYTPAYTSLLTWYDSIKDALDTIIPAHIALAQIISDPSDVRNLLNEYDSTYGGFTKEIRLIEIHHYLDSAGLDTLDTYAETELTDIADEYNGDTIVDDEAGYIGAKNMLRYFKSLSYEEPVVPLPGEQGGRLKKPESDSTETDGITFKCRPNSTLT